MTTLLFISATYYLPTENTSGLPVLGAILDRFTRTPEKPCKSPSVTEKQLPASQTMSQCWRLERSHYVSQDCFVRINRGIEGIASRGTKSCFNIGWCGCFIPRFSENLAKSLLGDRAVCVMTTKQQKLFVPVMPEWSKDRSVHTLQLMGNMTRKA